MGGGLAWFMAQRAPKRREQKTSGMDERLFQYVVDHVRDPPILKKIRKVTTEVGVALCTCVCLECCGACTAVIAPATCPNPARTRLAAGVRFPHLVRHRQMGRVAQMLIGADEAQMLQFLVKTLKVKSYLEVGTFTGMSSTAVALAMPVDGRVVACDVDKKWTDIARGFWVEAGVEDKIGEWQVRGLRVDAWLKCARLRSDT